MTRKQRSIAALALLVVVAVGSYAFLGWQESRPAPVPDVTANVATTTQHATDTEPFPSEIPTAPDPQPVASNHAFGTVTIRIGETASFPNGFSLRPLAVIEDSRCPQGVQCIQAGTVRVSAWTRSSSGSVNVREFVLGQAIAGTAETVMLVSVTPGTIPGRSIAATDYRFAFDVQERRPNQPGQCFVGGCSSQLCTDDPAAISTCEYRSEYACYRTATCERQSSGECGWTQTDELRACLANPPAIE